jgi:hypothetical protein
MKKPKNLWYIWSKSLGEKASSCNKTSDKVAVVRTFMFFTYLITNIFICAGVIKHWNDETKVYVEVISDNPTLPMIQTKNNRTGEFE